LSGSGHFPADDITEKDIDHESDKALPGSDNDEIRDPQRIRLLGGELPSDAVRRTRRVGVADRGFHSFAAHDSFQPHLPHEAFRCATRKR